jgi:O-antigen ligase
VFFAGAAVRSLAAGRDGRRVLVVLGAMAASLVISTVFSTFPAGSISGSTWRRFGFPVQISLLIFFLAALAALSANRDAQRLALRAVAAVLAISAVYGIVQYFELDPLIQKQLYSAGQYNQPILRPPSTLGSATNLANFALIGVFLCLGMRRAETERLWRYLGGGAAVLGAVAVVLSGTRAALAGLAAGAVFLGIRYFRAINRKAILASALAMALLAAFYLSPAGYFLRNRAVQAWGDYKGGTRPWLWRDSLRMAAGRPLFGYGLDTFSLNFPRSQSAALSIAYPDAYNESPHNFALDVLLAQGVAGVAPLIAMLWLAFSARGREKDFVRAGLLALVTSCLFFCFEVTSAIYFYFALAVLLATPVSDQTIEKDSGTIRFCQAWAALLLIVFATETAVSDAGYERARRDLANGDLTASVADYEAGRAWFPLGFNSSLWYSRNLLGAAQRLGQVAANLPEISRTAQDAYHNAEDRQNAGYHLAMLYASQGQFARASSLLEECIRLAPTWYVPYWAAAMTDQSLGRDAEAREMAAKAVEFSGKHRTEMTQFLDSIPDSR